MEETFLMSIYKSQPSISTRRACRLFVYFFSPIGLSESNGGGLNSNINTRVKVLYLGNKVQRLHVLCKPTIRLNLLHTIKYNSPIQCFVSSHEIKWTESRW